MGCGKKCSSPGSSSHRKKVSIRVKGDPCKVLTCENLIGTCRRGRNKHGTVVEKRNPCRIITCEDLIQSCGKVKTKHSTLSGLPKRERRKIYKSIYRFVKELLKKDVISSKEFCDITCENVKQTMRMSLLKYPDCEVKSGYFMQRERQTCTGRQSPQRQMSRSRQRRSERCNRGRHRCQAENLDDW